MEELLAELRKGQCPQDSDEGHENTTDTILNALNYKDFPALQQACARLAVKAKDKKLDVTFRARITAMVRTLNLYLDPELTYSWREASLIAAKSQGAGIKDGSKRARNIRTWIHQYLAYSKLPLHHHGQNQSFILDDEDFSQDIQLHLMEMAKDGYICAQDVVDYVASP